MNSPPSNLFEPCSKHHPPQASIDLSAESCSTFDYAPLLSYSASPKSTFFFSDLSASSTLKIYGSL